MARSKKSMARSSDSGGFGPEVDNALGIGFVAFDHVGLLAESGSRSETQANPEEISLTMRSCSLKI